MSEKTLKFDNIKLNKKEFHKSKQPIDLMSVNIEHKVTSDKFKHSDDGFKYFIGYQGNKIVKPLRIILPQMSEKNMSFMIKGDNILDKYNEICDKIKKKFSIKFHSMLVYDQTYLNAKVKDFDGVIKTNILVDEIPNESMHYTCIASITITSVIKIEKKNYLQFHLEECKSKAKKIQMPRFINTKLESNLDSDSDSESQSDTELKSESEVESDTE